jgi:signal transduction histidine kinase
VSTDAPEHGIGTGGHAPDPAVVTRDAGGPDLDADVFRDLARIIRSDDVLDVLPRACQLAAEIVGARQAALSQLPDVEGAEPVVIVHLASRARTAESHEGVVGIGRFPWLGSTAERLTDAELRADPRYRDLVADVRPPIRGLLAAPIVDGEGRTRGRIVLSDPIDDEFTDRHEGLLGAVADVFSAALERRRLQARLEDTQRQRQVFFGVVSHELRTPITTIYGGIRMLTQAGARLSHDTREQLLEDISAESDRLYRLVEDLLVLSRSERDALDVAAEPILLQHLLSRVVASEQQRAPWSRLRLSVDPDLPPVMGDSTLVEQVTRNLLSNAIKYAGGDGPIAASASTSEGWVEVRVADEGPGVDVDAVDHVFELFYRAPDAPARAQGAGIGLYVSNELVRAMGGEMWVRRRDARGTEFGFRLRAYDDSSLD